MQLSPLDLATLQLRRRSFQLVLADLRVQGALIVSGTHHEPRFAVCPCCGYPTLASRSYHETCTICWWEDDGQDDSEADRIRGGPNGDYSLSEARANFAEHRTHYRPDDKGFANVAKCAAERARVVAAYDVLLPDVRPWSFISALSDIDELYTALREREIGKRKVRRRRAVSDDPRRREDRNWKIWTMLDAVAMPRAWRLWGPPSICAHRAQTFDAFVKRVDVALARRLGRDALVFSRDGAGYCRWSSGQRDVWMTHVALEARVQVLFEPYIESQADLFVGFEDAAGADTVADAVARYFAERAASA